MTPQSEQQNQLQDIPNQLRKINQQLTEFKQLNPIFQTHWVGSPDEIHGTKGLIIRILKDQRAIWTDEVDSLSSRAEAIAVAMYTEDIIARAKDLFTGGTTRYCAQSIKNCLNEMKLESQIAKIRLSNTEDSQRPHRRPRSKWYLPRN